MNDKPANRSGWIGRANYSEATTPDRWGAWENALAAMRRALAWGRERMLPFAPPTDSGHAVLSAELTVPNDQIAYAQGGERYYGFQWYASPDVANGANWGPGYLDMLMGGNYELYGGALPLETQPNVQEPPPWERNGLF